MPLYLAQVRAANNQLCILLGVPVRDLASELGDASIPLAPPDVAVGIPADLLRRRPDVRAAERRVAAQCALIGVSMADLLPHFSITGNLQFNSQRFRDLLSSASTAAAVAPASAGIFSTTVAWSIRSAPTKRCSRTWPTNTSSLF